MNALARLHEMFLDWWGARPIAEEIMMVAAVCVIGALLF